MGINERVALGVWLIYSRCNHFDEKQWFLPHYFIHLHCLCIILTCKTLFTFLSSLFLSFSFLSIPLGR